MTSWSGNYPLEVLSLTASLQRQAERTPDKIAFTFLSDGGRTAIDLTYGELDRQARSIAAAMQARGLGGKRVLLLYVPGLDFVTAIYGCFYAGATAVPAYPPEPGRMDRALPRLLAIIKDCEPSLVMSTSLLLEMAQFVFTQAPELAELPREASDVLALAGREGAWRNPQSQLDELALVQYTSGSTSVPKGVMVSQRNLLSNMRQMAVVCRMGEHTRICSWLPFYHDMGLIGGTLLGVNAGGRTVLMSPVEFLQQPMRWLTAITRYRTTDSFVPNFALDLCVRKTSPEERQTLDLSSMQMIVVAAEPVRHASVEQFIQTFQPHGLAPACICPGYGLAEAVLAVTGGPVGKHYRHSWVDAGELLHNRWVEVERGHKQAHPLIASGHPFEAVSLAIVDPATGRRAGPGEVGEVWVHGPSVALGYWKRDAALDGVYGARLEGDERSWLRTGDLGYLKDNDLYITGRIKDLLIIRGKNHYPQDIELTVEQASACVRPGCVAAFALEREDTEQLVIVAEVDVRELAPGEDRQGALDRALRAIQAQVSLDHGVAAHTIVLIKPRTIEKTSSGKIARHASRRRFLEKTLQVEAEWTAPAPAEASFSLTSGPGTEEDLRRSLILSAFRRAPVDQRPRLLVGYFERELSRVLGRSATRLIDPAAPLQELGLDSLGVLSLSKRVEKDLGVELPVTKLLGSVSLKSLVDHLLAALETAGPQAGAEPRERTAKLTLSLQPIVVRRPFFCIGGALGSALYLMPLAEALGRDQPFYALNVPGFDGAEPVLRTVEELARRLLADLRAVQPAGPYVLGGHSFGGFVAYEMAQLLRAQGEQVLELLIIDSAMVVEPGGHEPEAELMAMFELINTFRRIATPPRDPLTADVLAGMSFEEQRQFMRTTLGSEDGVPPGFPIQQLVDVYRANFEAMNRYRPASSDVPVTLMRAVDPMPTLGMHPGRRVRVATASSSLGWDRVASRLRVLDIPGNHYTMVSKPHVVALAGVLREHLDGAGYLEIGLERLVPRRGAGPRGTEEASARGARGIELFNPLDPVYLKDPYPILKKLRTQDPVHWSAMATWCITRYADVNAGLRDKRFSVDTRKSPGIADARPAAEGGELPSSMTRFRSQMDVPLARFFNYALLFIDPGDHTRLRKLLAPTFEPRVIRRWRGEIEGTVNELLTEMRRRDDIDLIRDFALPLPIRVIARLLGLPEEDVPMLREWSYDVTQALNVFMPNEVFQRANQAVTDLFEYIRRHVEQRRTSTPREDVLGLMIAAEDEGTRLTLDELLANCILLFAAGFETTVNGIGNSLLALLQHPDQMYLLCEQPTLIENAVEELLRFDGPIRHAFRIALEDVELGGKLIRRGDPVWFSLSSANRDPEVFAEPDRLDILRNAKQHLTFSQGIHYCLGAPLARLEIQVALQTLIPLLPHLRLVPGGVVWRNNTAFRALETFRVTLATRD